MGISWCYMKHPFSIALVSILGVLVVALGCLFAFRAFNGAIIPPDWTENDVFTPENTSPTETSDIPLKTVSASGNIIVTSPTANATIGLPLVVTGSARVFENMFNYRLLDTDGTVLAEGSSISNAPDAGQFGDFTITTSYSVPTGTTGTVEVFDYSAKDGSVVDLASVPVVFPVLDSMTVKTYWTQAGLNFACSTEMFPTERRIPKTAAVGYAALTELLAGPNTKETQESWSTSIPSGVMVKSLTIVDGIAKVTFSSNLESGGSCRVSLIRAQIEATLKQFPTVTTVIISTEGKTPEESLQP